MTLRLVVQPGDFATWRVAGDMAMLRQLTLTSFTSAVKVLSQNKDLL